MEGFCQQGDKRAISGGARSSLATDVTVRTFIKFGCCLDAYVCFVPSHARERRGLVVVCGDQRSSEEVKLVQQPE